MRFTVWVGVVVLGLATACGGAPRPRLSEIRSSYTADWGSGGSRLVFDYAEESHIDTVSAYDSTGVLEATITFTYDGDLVEEMVAVDVSDNDTATFVLEYDDDDRLSRVDGTFVSTEGTGTVAVELDYDDDGNIVQLTETEVFGTDTDQDITEYEYDEDLLKRIQRLGSASVRSFDYDDEDQLEEIEYRYEGGMSTIAFTYKDSRVSRVVYDLDDRYEVEYNSDDYVSEVKNYWMTDVYTTEYTYEDGEMDGVVPTPGFPYGDLFHMEGQMMRPLEMTTLDMIDF